MNSSLSKQRVKYEDWKIAMAYFAKDSYMFSFDLKSGYHHIEILPEHQTFLGFSRRAPDSNSEIFYVFTVLPFGLSTAPYIFTKLSKPLEKHWRIQGNCIAIFLDDGWATVQDKDRCRATAQAVRRDLYAAGFCSQRREISVGTHPSFGLVRYNLEFFIGHLKNRRQKNYKDY